MSYKVEVLAHGETKWASNMLRFATQHEADAYGCDLFRRWTQAKEIRSVESDEPANSVFTNAGGALPICLE